MELRHTWFVSVFMTSWFVLANSVVAAGDPSLPGHHPLTQAQSGDVLISELRCAACHNGMPRGQLGILGDVVLSRPQPEAMGRIELDLRFVGNGWKSVSPQPKYQLQLGPCVVGGAYGITREFNHDYQCNTGLLPPGEYKFLLADFDLVQSRWTVTVKPGQITRLRFEASSPKVVQLAAESWIERRDHPR